VLKINCDLGEIEEQLFNDDLDIILPLVHMVNISCGAHAGSTALIHKTLKASRKYGVLIGAHPSYPDSENFGRKSMKLSFEELKDSLLNQLNFLHGMCLTYDIKLNHIKPHGALYNDMVKDIKLFKKVLKIIDLFSLKNLPLVIQPPQKLKEFRKVAESYNTPLIFEVFADRKYQDNGALLSRKEPGAVLEKDEEVFEQLKNIILHNKVITHQKKALKVNAHSICFHGDTIGFKNKVLLLNKIIHKQISCERLGLESYLFKWKEKVSLKLAKKISYISRKLRDEGLLQAIPAFNTLYVELDPFKYTKGYVEKLVNRYWVESFKLNLGNNKEIVLPCYYGNDVALDLINILERTNLSKDELIKAHSSNAYCSYAVGFLPGFAYLGMLDGRLAMPRLSKPRPKVRRGSVAMANAMTGVYPTDCPGGWNIIGNCPVELNECSFEVGDIVRFRPIEKLEFFDLGGKL